MILVFAVCRLISSPIKQLYIALRDIEQKKQSVMHQSQHFIKDTFVGSNDDVTLPSPFASLTAHIQIQD